MEVVLKNLAINTNSLPPISSVGQRILSIDLDSDKGENELLGLIESDPLIVARIVGIANSPLFGVGKKICSAREAVIRLGLNRVKSIATSIAIMSPIKMRDGKNFSAKNIWKHSLSIAMGMRTLAQKLPHRLRPSDDMVFLSGLLHDIGYLALAYFDPHNFDAFLESVEANPEQSFAEAEMNLFGMSHAALGGLIAKSWNLPPEVIAVIDKHHQLIAEDEDELLTMLLQLVEKMIGASTLFEGESIVSEQVEQDYIDRLGLSFEDMESTAEMLESQQEYIDVLVGMMS